jgi:hypothetical protein
MTLVLAFLTLLFSAGAAAQSGHWVISWGASPSPPPDATEIRADGLEFNNQTLRT